MDYSCLATLMLVSNVMLIPLFIGESRLIPKLKHCVITTECSRYSKLDNKYNTNIAVHICA